MREKLYSIKRVRCNPPLGETSEALQIVASGVCAVDSDAEQQGKKWVRHI